MSANAHGLTVADVAKRLRVSPDKIRGWIKRGELAALNVANQHCGRPRFVITVEALAAFEQSRSAATPSAPKPKRRRKTTQIDFYPD